MRFYPFIFILFLFFALLCPASVYTEGGNVSEITLARNKSTTLWFGLVGSLNHSAPSSGNLLGNFSSSSSGIYSFYPNGSFYSSPVIITRLDFYPSVNHLSRPEVSDFSETGFFSNFSSFASLNWSNISDNPRDTFCNPCSYRNCTFENETIECVYITLKDGFDFAVLKFDNGTWEEPVFWINISNRTGFNGSIFEYEALLPVDENYFFYSVFDFMPPYVRILFPENNQIYKVGEIPFIFDISDPSGIDSCWYVLDGETHNLPSCTDDYLLSVLSSGAHHLTLYANDSLGNIGSDSVVFYTYIPEEETSYSSWPRGVFRISMLKKKGSRRFSILPLNIVYELPHFQTSKVIPFWIKSNFNILEVSCTLEGEAREWFVIELNKSSFSSANNSILGFLRLKATPKDLLLYPNKIITGFIICSGSYASVSFLSKSDLKIKILKPELSLSFKNVSAYTGDEVFVSGIITNTGEGEATNISISVPNARDISYPKKLAPGESGEVSFYYTPSFLGNQRIQITSSEFGVLMSKTTINIETKPVPKFLASSLERKDNLFLTVFILISLYFTAIYALKEFIHDKRKFLIIVFILFILLVLSMFFISQ